MSAIKGKFENINLDFDKLTFIEQAVAILDKARLAVQAGAESVAITYSANYEQTVSIESTYRRGEWNTGTSGAHQAQVMEEMLTMMNGSYSDLQGKMQISPITTMPGGTSYDQLFTNVQFHLGIVVSDIVRIQSLLDANWTVFGWQNQMTVSNKKYPYAIGGGIVSNMPQVISDMIQESLIKFHTDYN